MAEEIVTANTNYLEQLKAAAEAQMRRSAPELDDAGAQHKKQKVAGDGQHEHSEHVEGPVGRYAYAALEALTQGCSAFLGSCGFRRERSSTKEVLDILNKVLPTGTKLELVKVGCNGLVVVTAEAAEDQKQIDPAATVQEILQRIQSGELQQTKFCQRIMPAQTTCALTVTALTHALTTVVSTYIKQHLNSSNSIQQQQRPVEFAIAYKNRDNVTVASRQESSSDPSQQQLQDKQQQQQQQQAQHPQQAQRQQQQALSGVLHPVPSNELVDRGKAIQVAVGVMEKCCSALGGAKVNLVNPQVVLLLEVIPLARHQLACAVAAVPASIMVTKPKLAVKPIGTGGR